MHRVDQCTEFRCLVHTITVPSANMPSSSQVLSTGTPHSHAPPFIRTRARSASNGAALYAPRPSRLRARPTAAATCTRGLTGPWRRPLPRRQRPLVVVAAAHRLPCQPPALRPRRPRRPLRRPPPRRWLPRHPLRSHHLRAARRRARIPRPRQHSGRAAAASGPGGRLTRRRADNFERHAQRLLEHPLLRALARVAGTRARRALGLEELEAPVVFLPLLPRARPVSAPPARARARPAGRGGAPCGPGT